MALAPPSAKERLGDAANNINSRTPQEVQAVLDAAIAAEESGAQRQVDTAVLPELSPAEMKYLNDLHRSFLTLLKKEFERMGAAFPEEMDDSFFARQCDEDHLPHPGGANIALIPDGESGRGLAFLAGRQAGDVNIVCPLPVEGNLLFQHGANGEPDQMACRYALFLNAFGKWKWGYFEKPLPIHAWWNTDKGSAAHAAGIPVLNENAVVTLCKDKAITRHALEKGRVRIPSGMAMPLDPEYAQARYVHLVLAVITPDKQNPNGWVVKPRDQSGGEGVQIFSANEEKALTDYALNLMKQGESILIEERVESLPLLNPQGERMDWNVRVLMTRDVAGKPCVADFEIRMAPHVEGQAVNVHQGAEVIQWKTLADWMGWDNAERARKLRQIKRFAIRAAKACDAEAQETSGNPKTAGGFYGLDLIWSPKGLTAIESNAGNVGGLGSLAKLREGDAKLSALIPVLRHLGRKAIAQRDQLRGQVLSGTYQEVKPTASDLQEIARVLYNEEKYDLAYHYIAESLHLDFENAHAWDLYGKILHYGQKKYSKAIKAYSSCLLLSPSMKSAYEGLFYSYRARNRWSEAKAVAERFMALYPRQIEGYVWAGSADCELGDVQNASTEITRGLALVPDRLKEPKKEMPDIVVMAWAWLAKIALDQKDYPQAHTYLQKVLAARPNDWAGRVNMALYHIQAEGQTQEARKIYEGLVKEDPQAIEIWLWLAHTYFSSDSAVIALQVVNEGLEKNKESPALTMANVLCTAQAGFEEKALEDLKALFASFPNTRPDRVEQFCSQCLWGIRALEGQVAAKDLLGKLLAQDPNYANGWYLLQKLSFNEGDINRATQAALRMTEVFPKDPRGWVLATDCYLRMNGVEDLSRLRDLAERAYSLDPAGRSIPDAGVRSSVATALMLACGRYDEAIGIYRKLLKGHKDSKNPMHAYMRINLVVAYERKGDIPRALRSVRAALRQIPKNPTAHLLAGRYLAGLGKDAQSLQHFYEGFSLKPAKPFDEKFVQEYVDVVQRLGRPDASRQAREVLSKVDPEYAQLFQGSPAHSQTVGDDTVVEQSP